jgi:hypothetical protein
MFGRLAEICYYLSIKENWRGEICVQCCNKKETNSRHICGKTGSLETGEL